MESVVSRACLWLLLIASTVTSIAAQQDGNSESDGAGAPPPRADDDELDSAPFTVFIEGASSSRCLGSLVSLRWALTSASCTRARDLTARAPIGTRADRLRRITRVVVPATIEQESVAGAWLGGVQDVALVELAAPLGTTAGARPILAALAEAECGGDAQCYAVHALPPSRRLAMVHTTRAPDSACAAAAPHWATVRDQALCFNGSTLCPSDWGTGIVCDGKLCGVLSRSAGAGEGGEGEAAAGEGCGRLHAVQSVARWHRFLHCAHTLRQCGRGECKDQCEERVLDEEDAPPPSDPATPTPERRAESVPEPQAAPPTDDQPALGPDDQPAPSPDDQPASSPDDQPALGPLEQSTTTHTYTETETKIIPQRKELVKELADEAPGKQEAEPTVQTSVSAAAPTRSAGAAPPRVPARTSSPSDATAFTVRPAVEFEPGRPDFKAGEYGDNAVEYGRQEEGAPTSTPQPPTATSPPTPTPPRAHPLAAHPAPPSPPERHVPASAKQNVASSHYNFLHLHTSLLYFAGACNVLFH